ncbi:MAG: hypothetical protein ABI367_05470 [Mucilaginibacter sp.]
MKKAILLVTLLILAIYTSAQKSYVFKVKYLPNYIYKSSSEERLFPDINDNTEIFSVRTLSIETDKKNGKEKIPFKMFYDAKQRFIPMQEKFTQLNPKLDKQVYGNINDEKIDIDTVPGKKAKQVSDNDWTRIINEFELDLSFPLKPLSIGESFTRTAYIQIIHVGGLYQMPINITYILRNVKDNIAVFDTQLAMNFDFNWAKGFKAKGTAKGMGKLIFNIAKSYPEYISSDLEMNYSGSRTSIDIIVDTKPTTLRRVVEIKNEITPQ